MYLALPLYTRSIDTFSIILTTALHQSIAAYGFYFCMSSVFLYFIDAMESNSAGSKFEDFMASLSDVIQRVVIDN